jgi:hypothetical protein
VGEPFNFLNVQLFMLVKAATDEHELIIPYSGTGKFHKEKNQTGVVCTKMKQRYEIVKM